MLRQPFFALTMFALGCGCGPDPTAVCERPSIYEKSPTASLEGAGWHRVYVQGASAAPDADGRFGMTEHRNQVSDGDQFILSQGALVEWTYPLKGTLTGHVFLHLARVDDPGVSARYELSLVRDRKTIEIFGVDDESSGDSGYAPYEGCHFSPRANVRPREGAILSLRTTNLTGGTLGVVVRGPDYLTWIDVEVE